MEWENQPVLDELLTEAENLDAGYLSVARVNPDRREEQVGSWRTGPADELRGWLSDLAAELPPGTRLRIRLYRHGGKPVRGVVCRTPVPCPTCAELATAVQDQNHRLDEASDERDDALARIDELESALDAARDSRDAAFDNVKRLKHKLRTTLRQAAEWKRRAEHGEALAEMINALELP